VSEMHDDPYSACPDGFTVVQPKKWELFLDLDTPSSLDQYDAMLLLLQKQFVAVEYKRTTSRNGNTHVYLIVPALDFDDDNILRCALQACLGSDPKHELLSLLSILRSSPAPPTVFYERDLTSTPTQEPVL